MGIARLVGRNLPLVALAAAVGVLHLPEATPPQDASVDEDLGPVKAKGLRPLQCDPASPQC